VPRATVDRNHRVAVGHGILHAHRLVELRPQLVKINDLQLRALLHRARLRFQLPEQQF
jgi:hypothetical protein